MFHCSVLKSHEISKNLKDPNMNAKYVVKSRYTTVVIQFFFLSIYGQTISLNESPCMWICVLNKFGQEMSGHDSCLYKKKTEDTKWIINH